MKQTYETPQGGIVELSDEEWLAYPMNSKLKLVKIKKTKKKKVKLKEE